LIAYFVFVFRTSKLLLKRFAAPSQMFRLIHRFLTNKKTQTTNEMFKSTHVESNQ